MKTITKISSMILLTIIMMSGKCSSSDKEAVIEQMPILLVLGIDHSQTMDGFPGMSVEQLKSVCNALNKCNTNLCVAIGHIGNPSDDGFKRLQLAKVSNIDKSATMSVRARQRKERKQIVANNLELIQKFIHEVNLESKHTTKTCLNKFCADAAILLSEPQFAGYSKMVCLYTDGLEDCNGDNITEPLHIDFPTEVAVYTVGWKNNETIANNIPFADIKGFIQFINSLTK